VFLPVTQTLRPSVMKESGIWYRLTEARTAAEKRQNRFFFRVFGVFRG
jgi:hypothetical protein